MRENVQGRGGAKIALLFYTRVRYLRVQALLFRFERDVVPSPPESAVSHQGRTINPVRGARTRARAATVSRVFRPCAPAPRKQQEADSACSTIDCTADDRGPNQENLHRSNIAA